MTNAGYDFSEGTKYMNRECAQPKRIARKSPRMSGRYRPQNPMLMIWVAVLAFAAPSKAQLQFENTAKSAELKIEDSVARVEFPFRNIGTDAILIKHIRTSCGCTVATSSKQIYLPGESGKIVATVQIGSLHGNVDKTVIVETDDAQQPETKLSINVSAPALVSLSSTAIEWPEATHYDDRTVGIKILNTVRFRITGLRPWSEKFQASLIVIEDGKDYELRVRPSDGTKATISAVELLTDIPNPDVRTRIWVYLREI